jgi:hypothetical protein
LQLIIDPFGLTFGRRGSNVDDLILNGEGPGFREYAEVDNSIVVDVGGLVNSNIPSFASL